MVEHGGGVDFVTPGAGEKFASAEEDGSAIFVRHAGPGFVRFDAGLGGGSDFGIPGQMNVRQDVTMIMRDNGGLGVAGEDFDAIDYYGDFDGPLIELAVEFCFE